MQAGYYYTVPQETLILFGYISKSVAKVNTASMDLKLSVIPGQFKSGVAWNCSAHWVKISSQMMTSGGIKTWCLKWDGFTGYDWYMAYWQCHIPASAMGSAEVQDAMHPVVLAFRTGNTVSFVHHQISVPHRRPRSKHGLHRKVVMVAWKNANMLNLPRAIHYWRHHGFAVHVVTASSQLDYFRKLDYSKMNVSAPWHLRIGAYSLGSRYRVYNGGQDIIYNIALHEGQERLVCFFDADDFVELPAGQETRYFSAKLGDGSVLFFGFGQPGTPHCPPRPCKDVNFDRLGTSGELQARFGVLRMPNGQCWVYQKSGVQEGQTKMCVRPRDVKVVGIHKPWRFWDPDQGPKGIKHSHRMVVHLRRSLPFLDPGTCGTVMKG